MEKNSILKRTGAVILSVIMVLSAVFLLPDAVDSTIETQAAGSSFAKAKSINVNQSYTDCLSGSRSEDYFKFTLSSDSKIFINFQHDYIDSSLTYWSLYLYKDNNDRTEIYSCGIEGNYKSIDTPNIGLPRGTYYIKIDDGYYFSDMDYRIKVNSTATSNWEKEKNNTFETATSIVTNKEFCGTLSVGNDVDYYRFSIAQDSKVSISFQHNFIDSGMSYWSLYLYKENNSRDELYSYSIDGNYKSTNTPNIGLPRGTYYIKIDNGYYFSDMNYRIKVNSTAAWNWEKERNEVFETATSITANNEYCGSIMRGKDVDFYKVSLSGKVKINFRHNYIDSYETYWKLRLFKDDNTRTELASYYYTGDEINTTTDTIQVPKGTYYIRIESDYYFDDIDYKFTVKNEAVKPAPTSVKLNINKLTLGKGEAYTMKATVSPSNANRNITWTSSNKGVATVSGGKITAKKVGTTIITAKTSNGKKASCKVTVKWAPGWVALSKYSMTLKVGQKGTLSASIASDCGCAKRTFRTSTSKIVKMTNTNWTGSFKAVKPGTAWVTVRTYNGKEKSCKITVIR